MSTEKSNERNGKGEAIHFKGDALHYLLLDVVAALVANNYITSLDDEFFHSSLCRSFLFWNNNNNTFSCFLCFLPTMFSKKQLLWRPLRISSSLTRIIKTSPKLCLVMLHHMPDLPAPSDRRVAVSCVPCGCFGKATKDHEKKKMVLDVDPDADVDELRTAVACRLEPRTRGVWPFQETVRAEPQQIHFFKAVEEGNGSSALVPVREGVAQLADAPSTPLYYAVEGEAGNSNNANNNNNYDNNYNKPNPPSVQQTNQYNYYTGQPDQGGYNQNPYNGPVQGTGYGAPPNANYNQGYNGYNQGGYNHGGYDQAGYYQGGSVELSMRPAICRFGHIILGGCTVILIWSDDICIVEQKDFVALSVVLASLLIQRFFAETYQCNAPEYFQEDIQEYVHYCTRRVCSAVYLHAVIPRLGLVYIYWKRVSFYPFALLSPSFFYLFYPFSGRKEGNPFGFAYFDLLCVCHHAYRLSFCSKNARCRPSAGHGYFGKSPEAQKEKTISVEADPRGPLDELRIAVAARLEPRTYGAGPWQDTVCADPEHIYFFQERKGEGGSMELTPVGGSCDALGEAPLYYAVEDAGKGGKNNSNSGNNYSNQNYSNSGPRPPHNNNTNQYSYYNGQPNPGGYNQNPYNGPVQGTGYGAPPNANSNGNNGYGGGVSIEPPRFWASVFRHFAVVPIFHELHLVTFTRRHLSSIHIYIAFLSALVWELSYALLTLTSIGYCKQYISLLLSSSVRRSYCTKSPHYYVSLRIVSPLLSCIFMFFLMYIELSFSSIIIIILLSAIYWEPSLLIFVALSNFAINNHVAGLTPNNEQQSRGLVRAVWKKKMVLDVDPDADVDELRTAVACRLEPRTRGVWPFQETVRAEPQQIHFFKAVEEGNGSSALVPVREGVAQLADVPSTPLYYAVEGVFGDDGDDILELYDDRKEEEPYRPNPAASQPYQYNYANGQPSQMPIGAPPSVPAYGAPPNAAYGPQFNGGYNDCDGNFSPSGWGEGRYNNAYPPGPGPYNQYANRPPEQFNEGRFEHPGCSAPPFNNAVEYGRPPNEGPYYPNRPGPCGEEFRDRPGGEWGDGRPSPEDRPPAQYENRFMAPGENYESRREERWEVDERRRMEFERRD
eukprot:gene2052-1240_t